MTGTTQPPVKTPKIIGDWNEDPMEWAFGDTFAEDVKQALEFFQGMGTRFYSNYIILPVPNNEEINEKLAEISRKIYKLKQLHGITIK